MNLMSNYLSTIATRSNDISQTNAVMPEGSSRHSSLSSQDFIEVAQPEVSPIVRSTVSNIDNVKSNPNISPSQTISNIQKPKENKISSNYLTKHIERFNTEKVIIYDKKEIQVVDNQIFKNENQKINQPVEQLAEFLQPQSDTIEKQKQKALSEDIVSKKEFFPTKKSIVSNQLESEDIVTKKEFFPIKKPIVSNQLNQIVHLRPSQSAVEPAMSKKAPSPPKLVIGRITVEIVPPVASITKTIIKTEQRNNSTKASNNTVHKLSFGLGQL